MIEINNQIKNDCKNRLIDFCYNHFGFNQKESTSKYKKFQCIFCGSGTGKHGTGNLTIYQNNPTHYKCLVCGNTGDIYTIASELYGLDINTQFKEIVQKVFDEFNINVSMASNKIAHEYIKPIPQKHHKEFDMHLDEYTLQLTKDDIIEAEKHLLESRYLSDRDISLKVQRKFHCGYLKAWVHPQIRAKVGNDYSLINDNLKSERIIIPDGDINNLNSYTARAINPKDELNGRKAMKTANPKVFNANALKNTDPQVIFVVEGAIDSMSIETLGYTSIAIGSTAYVKKFFDNYQINANTTLVISLDNDKAGIEATKQIATICQEKKIAYIIADMDIYGPYKDANECLVKKRGLLKINLSKMFIQANNLNKTEFFKECEKMKQISNQTVPNPIQIIGLDTRKYNFPEVTYENIISDDTLNYFGQLSTEMAVNDYYKYLIEKSRTFRKFSECKPHFDTCKKTMLEYLRNWKSNKKANGNVSKDDLPNWVLSTDKGKYYIDEIAYCEFKVTQKNIRTIDNIIYTLDGAIDEKGLEKEILMDISKYIKVGVNRLTNDILQALKTYTYSKQIKPDVSNVHLLNGTFNLTTNEFKHEKQWCTNRLNISYNPNAKLPKKFLKFLDQLLEKDDIKTLQEYLGYGLIPTTIAQKLLFIVGCGGEGKSIIGKVYKQILGDNNVYSAHIHQLQDKSCQLANCVAKLVNIDDDTEFSALKDTGTLKEVISGGSVTVEKKYQAPFMTTLYSRLLCFSNSSLQALYDRSDGFYRRQLLIQVKPKVKNMIENPNLANELIEEELDGIFNWILEGLQRLINNNYQFTVSEKSKQLLEHNKRDSFNFIQYIENKNQVQFTDIQESSETCQEIYFGYQQYCYDNALEPLSRKSVTNYLMQNANSLGIKYDTNILSKRNGRRARGFKGIKIFTYYCGTDMVQY